MVKGSLTCKKQKTGGFNDTLRMRGSKKIKDIFIDLKVPKEERESRLIIADDENIIWLEGYRINDKYKVSDATERILKISIGRLYE